MKRTILFLVLLFAAGCVSRVTDRIDTLNNNVSHMSSKLDDTNARLANIEKSMKKLSGEGNVTATSPANP